MVRRRSNVQVRRRSTVLSNLHSSLVKSGEEDYISCSRAEGAKEWLNYEAARSVLGRYFWLVRFTPFNCSRTWDMRYIVRSNYGREMAAGQTAPGCIIVVYSNNRAWIGKPYFFFKKKKQFAFLFYFGNFKYHISYFHFWRRIYLFI